MRPLITSYYHDITRSNLMTRSILCKFKGELTNHDFNRASQLFRRTMHIDKGFDFKATVKLLRSVFNRRFDLIGDSIETNVCMKKLFYRGVIENRIDVNNQACIDIVKQIVDANLFDLDLYSQLK